MSLDSALVALLPAMERAAFAAVVDTAGAGLRIVRTNLRFAAMQNSADGVEPRPFPSEGASSATRVAVADLVSRGSGGAISISDPHLAAGATLNLTLLPLGGGAWLGTVEPAAPRPAGQTAAPTLIDAVATISDGFALFDAEDRLVLANRKLIEMSGLDDGAFRPGTTYAQILESARKAGRYIGSDEEVAALIADRLLRHRNPPNLDIVQLSDGRILRVSQSRTADGGSAMVYTDITEMKKIEAMLRKAAAEAEAASQAKSEFLANMSHELRTPLNAIIGFAEIIAGNMLGADAIERYRGYARDIGASGRHLLDVVNQVLDMAKIEAGQFELREEPVDVADLADTVARLMEPLARDAHVTLGVEIQPGLPRLSADRRGLQQIMLNLLSNAIKFTPRDGKVELRVAVEADGTMAIAVADTGIGMAEDDIPIALAPFGQIDTAMTRAHTGTGLGLPIVKATAELHGGTLSIQSKPGQGTTVTVRMPARRVHGLRTATRSA